MVHQQSQDKHSRERQRVARPVPSARLMARFSSMTAWASLAALSSWLALYFSTAASQSPACTTPVLFPLSCFVTVGASMFDEECYVLYRQCHTSVWLCAPLALQDAIHLSARNVVMHCCGVLQDASMHRQGCHTSAVTRTWQTACLHSFAARHFTATMGHVIFRPGLWGSTLGTNLLSLLSSGSNVPAYHPRPDFDPKHHCH